ncbi:MAG: hypothetical protein EXR92_04160 [Gemmatimonadetes bacterium]|nr:hypothetical protein [Gemmatimonadota bacterium]
MKMLAETGSNQTYGVDASFAFQDNVTLFGYLAATRTDGLTGDDKSYRSQISYNGATWGANMGHLFVGDDFNPEVGFARRKGFRQSMMSGRYSPRPASVERIRRLLFQAGVEYLENARRGVLEARDQDVHFGIELENSDSFNASYTESFERLFNDAPILGTTIAAGGYSTKNVQVSYGFGSQRPYSGALTFQRGDYYTGRRTSLGFSQGRIEILRQLSLEPTLAFNWISLPQGDFDQHLALARVNYSVSPRMYVRAIVQYNSGSDSFSSNLRLRWEWAPGSEVFVVYTEERDTDVLDRWSELANRGLVIKVTRLLRL